MIAMPRARGATSTLGIGLELALVARSPPLVALAGIVLRLAALRRRPRPRDGPRSAERFPRVAPRAASTSGTSTSSTTRSIVRPLAALARFFWKVVDAVVIDGASTPAPS